MGVEHALGADDGDGSANEVHARKLLLDRSVELPPAIGSTPCAGGGRGCRPSRNSESRPGAALQDRPPGNATFEPLGQRLPIGWLVATQLVSATTKPNHHDPL
jgi:hypothetical protein